MLAIGNLACKSSFFLLLPGGTLSGPARHRDRKYLCLTAYEKPTLFFLQLLRRIRLRHYHDIPQSGLKSHGKPDSQSQEIKLTVQYKYIVQLQRTFISLTGHDNARKTSHTFIVYPVRRLSKSFHDISL